MKQRVGPGAELNFLTPDEMVKMIPRPRQHERIRAPAVVQLDSTGSGLALVYKVPAGMEFALRRVTFDISGATDPSTGNVPLNVAGKFVAYLRSGTRIEFAVPQSPNAIPQVPGVQTWGDQQGPYMRNGEVLQIQAAGLTANAFLNVTAEGILTERAEK